MITRDVLEKALALPATTTTDFDLNPEVVAALPPNRKLRPAAVLVPIFERGGELRVVLTKRASNLKHHPGQVAFPGGKAEEADADLSQTALREAEEEIGLDRRSVRIAGSLNTHETVTSFLLTPFVGFMDDFTPTPQPEEVDEVFDVPLDFLMDPLNMSVQGRRWRGNVRRYYTIPYGPYYIWGASARIVHGLAERVAQCR